MKIRNISLTIIFFAIILSLFMFNTTILRGNEFEPYFAGGSGTEDDPYLVETPEHLFSVQHYLEGHFQQIADIDLADFETKNYYEDEENARWWPIVLIEGSYDGSGYKIYNLTASFPEYNNIGLFGYIESEVVISNVILENVKIKGDTNVGGLIGLNRGGDIYNCHVKGNVKGNEAVGGLFGKGSYMVAEIVNSGAEVNVRGKRNVGGLAGSSSYEIRKSYVKGEISGLYRVGGLAGESSNDVSQSYAVVEVEGKRKIGGLIGFNNNYIKDSYALGYAEGNREVGGLTGEHRHGGILNSYAAVRLKGDRYIDGLVGLDSGVGVINDSFFDREFADLDEENVRSKSTTKMMSQNTFKGWDFDTIWGIDEGKSYPYLQWQDDVSHNY